MPASIGFDDAAARPARAFYLRRPHPDRQYPLETNARSAAHL